MPHPLYALFHPQAVAVVGASDRYGSNGRNVFSRLLAEQTAPLVVPVNPKHKTVGGLTAYENLAEACANHPIDTAVVILSADKLPAIVREAAKANVAQLVFVSDLEQPTPAVAAKLKRAAETAEKAGIRLVSVPTSTLSDFYYQSGTPSCAYIGQSVGIADCLRSYAIERGITFSRFITINPFQNPVSLGQIIDSVAAEPDTTALLVHVSGLESGRELVSALATAARGKPVVVLPTLADTDQDALFKQALERSHVFNVSGLLSFLTAAKLAHANLTCRGKRISLISNTAHIGALALKNLLQSGLEPAQHSPQTARLLTKILSHKPVRTNPLYLSTDAPAGIIRAAVEACLQDEHSDAVLLIYTGQDPQESLRTAQLTAALQQRYRSKPLFLVWLGSADTAAAQTCFRNKKNLSFRQPEQALHAILQLEYHRRHHLQRYQSGSFYDYRHAGSAADRLHKNLRPMLPVVAHPATKIHHNHLLTALGFIPSSLKKDRHETELVIQWQHREPIGQVLILNDLPLLPPLSPETAARTLLLSGLPETPWQTTLLDTAEILSRLPEINSLRLELYADDSGKIICRDIKLSLQDPDSNPTSPNLIAPYPQEEEQQIRLPNGEPAWLRPVRPQDAELIRRLIEAQSERSRYLRFMSTQHSPPPSLTGRLSRFDYNREFALLLHDADHHPLATAAYNADPGGESCEFGISTADHLQGQGIGTLLMSRLINRARKQGYRTMRAEILTENTAMQKLAQKLGFTLSPNPHDPDLLDARLDL